MSVKLFNPVGSPQNVAYSTTSVTLFGSTPTNVFRSVYNDSDKACYILFNGTPVSTSLFNHKIPSQTLYVFPFPLYTNQVNIIWDAAGSGAARTMEY